MKRNPPKPEAMVRQIYRMLSRAWGPQHWWPAETPFEVIVGAILTQNTSWTNVERALTSLRQDNALTVEALRNVPVSTLERLIRSSGYYRQKAQALKNFIAYLDQGYGGSLERMFTMPTLQLRNELLSVKGIGHETADAVLLYAGRHGVFVVDAYARRILSRHNIVSADERYDEIRELVERALREKGEKLRTNGAAAGILPERFVVHEPSAMSRSASTPLSQVFNEMHGLLVQVGKHYCRKDKPNCSSCPLQALLPENPKEGIALVKHGHHT
jgi:endonuclease-3 related protein